MTISASLLASLPSERGAARESVSAAELVLVGAALALLASMLYRSWDAMPFPVTDFGGWLVTLSSAQSSLDAFRALAMEHAREGRFNPLSMAYVAVNWAIFGDATAGWQIVRAIIMLVAAVGAYVVFRMLGARRGASLLGACLYIIADSARAVWLMPQAFEHIAGLLVIAASAVALARHRAKRTRVNSVVIAALLVCALWVREPMVAAIPFVILLALCHRAQGHFATPRIDRSALELVGIVGVTVLVLNVVPVLAVRTMAEPASYASRFGPENVSLENFRNVAFALGLPVTRTPWFPANALLLAAVVLAVLLRTPAARSYRIALVIATTLPLCAAAVYVMWPAFPGNYGLPYLLGIAMAFSLTMGMLWRGSTIHRSIAVISAAAILGFGSLLALNDRREYAAARRLDVDMASAVSSLPTDGLLEAAIDDPARAGAFARGLRAYAKATLGARDGPANDIDCAAAQARVTTRKEGAVLLRPPHGCLSAAFPEPTTLLRRTATVRDWKTLRSQPWEVTAAFWHSGTLRLGTPR
jgi:hypothetical protein